MRTSMRAAAALIAGSMLFAGAAYAQPTPEYLMKAGASDLYEMRSSKLVLGSTKDASLKKFANEMITDHTKSTAQVKAAATKSGITPKPPMLNAEQRDMVAKLTAAHGTERDHLYVEQQKTAHQQALQVQQDYASSGDKPALKAAAAKIVPVVQHHIDMLNGMPAA